MGLAKDLPARERRFAFQERAANGQKLEENSKASVDHLAVEVPAAKIVVGTSVDEQGSSCSFSVILLAPVGRKKLLGELDIQ